MRNTGKKYYRNEREVCDDLVEDDERVPDLDIVLALQAHHQRLRNLLTQRKYWQPVKKLFLNY
jgi:hypothetical protein